jgi:membrane protein implicated in regulation of membrane protease activity
MIPLKYAVNSIAFIVIALIANAILFKAPWYWVVVGAFALSMVINLIMYRIKQRRVETVEPNLVPNDPILTNRPIITNNEIETLKADLNHNQNILQNRPVNDIKVE